MQLLGKYFLYMFFIQLVKRTKTLEKYCSKILLLVQHASLLSIKFINEEQNYSKIRMQHNSVG